MRLLLRRHSSNPCGKGPIRSDTARRLYMRCILLPWVFGPNGGADGAGKTETKEGKEETGGTEEMEEPDGRDETDKAEETEETEETEE